MYSTDGKGNWWKREWCQKCAEEVFIYGQCQGVVGHNGVHWRFGESGDFKWQINESGKIPRDSDAVCGTIPPDHKSYKTPLVMEKHYWLSHYVDSKVTDPKDIKRLEADKVRDGESINRPLDLGKLPAKLRKQLTKRLKTRSRK